MAKSSTRGAGPGTNDRGGVRSTMSPAFGSGASRGAHQKMAAPFNEGVSSDPLPHTIYAPAMPTPGSKTAPNSRDVPGTILTNPKGPRR